MNTKKLFSAYRAMWLIVMFDLPTDTPKARKSYGNFHNALLDDGFQMLQYSVYARFCPSEDNLQVHINRVKIFLPPDGEVRLLTFTDKQFSRMQVFQGKIRKIPEEAPLQIAMF